jgi:hypothetical protein
VTAGGPTQCGGIRTCGPGCPPEGGGDKKDEKKEDKH